MILRSDFEMKSQIRVIWTWKKKAMMKMIEIMNIWEKNTLKQKGKLILKF